MDQDQEQAVAEGGAPAGYLWIGARSRRQAMDWSLVLASQEIHPIISGPEEGRAWGLWVEPGQHGKALESIKLYRLENRGWSWKTAVPGSNLELHAGALFWCIFLGLVHWIVTFANAELERAGRMDSAAVLQGSWWRLFTPIILHADLAHLMANATFGVLILGLAMARFGAGVTLLATYFCGAFGNVLGLVLYSKPYFGIGASGMMMGALGMLCIHGFGLWRKNPKAARYVFSGVLAGILLFVLFGLSMNSDIIAHVGGFFAGLVFGAVLSVVPESKLAKNSVNWVALVLLGSLLVCTWAIALRNQ
jgi:rhomboid protease GluP